jgi:acyl carrier protein
MTEEKPKKPEAVSKLLDKVEKKPWPSRSKKYEKKKPDLSKLAFMRGYFAKQALVDVTNEYNPSAPLVGNQKAPTSFTGKETEGGQYIGDKSNGEEKLTVNPGQSVDDFKVGSPLSKQAAPLNQLQGQARTDRFNQLKSNAQTGIQNLQNQTLKVHNTMNHENLFTATPTYKDTAALDEYHQHPASHSVSSITKKPMDDKWGYAKQKLNATPPASTSATMSPSQNIGLTDFGKISYEMVKRANITTPDTNKAGGTVNLPDIPSKMKLPFSGSIVNMGQESEGGGGPIARNEWPNKNQRSEGAQANFNQEDKEQQNPAGMDKVNAALPQINHDQIVRDSMLRQLGITPKQINMKGTWDQHGADSLDRIELIMDMEQRLGRDISDAEAEQWSTPELMVQGLKNYKAPAIPKQASERPFKKTKSVADARKVSYNLVKRANQMKVSSVDAANPSDTGYNATQSDTVHRNTFVEEDHTHQSESPEETEKKAHPYSGVTLDSVKKMNAGSVDSFSKSAEAGNYSFMAGNIPNKSYMSISAPPPTKQGPQVKPPQTQNDLEGFRNMMHTMSGAPAEPQSWAGRTFENAGASVAKPIMNMFASSGNPKGGLW